PKGDGLDITRDDLSKALMKLNLHVLAGKAIVLENVHTIISLLIKLISYPHLMVRSNPFFELFQLLLMIEKELFVRRLSDAVKHGLDGSLIHKLIEKTCATWFAI
ncbi:hypothetical protein BHM03_00012538, partial [Ensete ventricosum]